MSTRQFAITVFHLIIFVLTPLVVFADQPAAEMDELPPVPTFKVPSTPEDPDFQQKLADAWRGNEKDESKDEQKDKTKEQTEKVADKPADIAPVENWDELPPIPTYTPQSKPKDEAKEQSEKSAEKPDNKRNRLIKEAVSGNAEAAMELVKEAENSNFKETAEPWLKIAAEAGSGEALYKLGRKAIEEDDDKTAFECLKKSADAGYEDAKIYLAFGYIEGRGTKKDVEKGKTLLQSVADSGNAKAICKLAMAYYHGIGFEKDEKKAIDMLSQLYQKETDDSALLESALLLVSVDEKRGIKLIDDLLDKLNESSNLTLEGEEDKASALMMSIGYHVLNNTDADKPIVQKRLCSLVEMFNDSQVEGVRKELIAGVIMGFPIADSNILDSVKQKLFLRVEQLAQDGDCNAMLWLAYLYLKGIGTEKNRPLFDYWLDRAAWAGNPLAQFYAVIFSKVENEYDNTKNMEYLKQSIEKGIFPAWCLYAINALRIEAKSQEEAEIKKKILEEAEKHINQLLKEKRDFQAKASGKDFVFHINNQYEKWGIGIIGGGIGGKLLDRQFIGRYYSRSVTPEDMEFLYAPNYYVNISDLAYAVAVYYQKKNSDGTKDKEKIRERFKTAIELGNNLALKALIEDYWDSDEDEKALETLKTALDDNLPWAYLLQFKYTCYNPDGTENFEQAFPYLQKAAEMNDKEANKFLGMCYVLGKGVKQDVEKGVKILEDNKVYLDLLLIYGKGLGVKRDEEKSKLYYARNFANANIDNEEQTQFIVFKTSVKQSFISENYEEMLISSKYREDSNKYFLKRMEKEGDALATVYLGMQKMDVNVKRALFRKAAQDGDMFVKAYAGYILLSICGGDEQLKQEALALLHKAAHAGQAIAMNGLGGQLCNDAVGENDPVKRAKLFEEMQQWLKQAADKGNMSAYLFITEAFINSGEQVDMEEYQRYLDRAIELNIPLAMELKAYYLISDFNSEEFHGFPPKAIELLQRAADLGSSGAIERLQKINNYQSDQTTEQNSWSRGTLKKDSDAREKFDDYMSNQRRKSDYGLPPLQNYLPDRYNNNQNSNDLIPQLNL